MLKITNILNPLTGGATTQEYVWEKGKPLSEYMEYNGECVVACNGTMIDLPPSEIFPARKETYIVMPVPVGGDRQTQRNIGYFALTAALMMIPGAQAAAFHGIWMPQTAKLIAFLMGSSLIETFLRNKPEDQSQSQSYSWRHVSSLTAAHGLVMPVVYGKARVRPIIKNRFVTMEGDKQRLFVLFGVAGHKVDERTLPEYVLGTGDYEVKNAAYPGMTFINKRSPESNQNALYGEDGNLGEGWRIGHGTASFADDIIINGRVIGDYHDDVQWETRPGLPEQIFIEGFHVTYTNYSIGTTLYRDLPEIDTSYQGIGLRCSGTAGWIIMKEHTLSFHGTTYKISGFLPSGARSINTGDPGGLRYIVWNSETGINKYTVTSAAPTASTDYLIATLRLKANEFIHFYTGYPIWTQDAAPTNGDWTTLSQIITDVHNIELYFEFPNGLYDVTINGAPRTATARIFAQYAEVDEDGNLTSRWYNFHFPRLGNSDYPSAPYDSGEIAGIIRRNNPSPFSLSFKALPDSSLNYLGTDKRYRVHTVALSTSAVQLVNMAGIVYAVKNADGSYEGFTFPGEALLGIKALASGQLSGELDVQVDVERSKVWMHDSVSTWVQKMANNHAWAVYDILAQGHPDHQAYPTAGNDDAEAIYGCGIDHNRLDYTSFPEWADNITAIGYELNIVFDTPMTAWDAILRICQEGRGMVYPVGTKIYAFTDKASDITQLFTMGNIHVDTFVQKYVEESNKANMVETTYYDQDNNYGKTMIAARTANWDSSTGLSKPISITLYGTTAFEQAWSISRFLLMGNELLSNVISFGVDVDALAAQAGDVVEVQHDILTTGVGGRLLNVLHNYLLGGDFETAGLPNWSVWGSPTIHIRSADQQKYNSYSLHTRSPDPVVPNATNSGMEQTFTVKPSTQYTLSCWIYMLNVYTADATIRAMTKIQDGPYYSGTANKTLLNQWQRVSVTITTSSTQTSATVWLGGIGEAYFDGVMMEEGATAHDFMSGTALTLDRVPGVVGGGQQYEMKFYHNNGTVQTQYGLLAGHVSDDTVTFGELWTWTRVPEMYELYSFGIRGAHTYKYRIVEISRTNELMRTLTLIQYDADMYGGYTPGDPIIEGGIEDGQMADSVPPSDGAGPGANLLNRASNLRLREIISGNPTSTGNIIQIVAIWDTETGDPRGKWEIWFRDVDVSDVDWKGTWEEGEYGIGDKVEKDGKTYVSLEDDNITTPFLVE